jgi:peptide/nickel transport system permease protein
MCPFSSRGLAKSLRDLGNVPRIRELKFTSFLLRQSPLVMVGIGIGVGAFVLSFLSPWIAPFGEQDRNWGLLKAAPSWSHLFGTDGNGGDIFSRVLYGLRLDLVTAMEVVAVGAAIGILVGVVSGYLGRITDEVLMRVTDIFLAFPGLILSMAIATALGRNWTNLTISLMIVWWPGYARLIRGQVLVEKEKLYVEAARSVGASNWRLAFRHILPNSIYPLLVAVTLDIGGVMLTAAGLSFIGFGADVGVAELGRMVSDAEPYMLNQPWIMVFPGLAILITAIGFNLIGDGLRDVLDPRLRR